MKTEIFNRLIQQPKETEDTFKDISAVQLSYGTYRVEFYSYDLVNFTPTIDAFGRTKKDGGWREYEPTKSQLEAMRSVLEDNFKSFLKTNDEEQSGSLSQEDHDHLSDLWIRR